MWKRHVCLILVFVWMWASGGIALGVQTWEGRISDGNDDIEEHLPAGNMDITSSDTEMPHENTGQASAQIVGLRFLNVNVPAGSAIMNAYVEFVVDELKDSSLLASILIDGELSPDAAAFDTTANNLSSRTTTSAKVVWVVAEWTAAGQVDQTVNIGPVIEEIVGQSGWAQGNSLVLMFRDDPDNPSLGVRAAESYDGDAGAAALLHIEWGPPVRASGASPLDGEVDVLRDTDLSWQPGEFAQTHDVYFGSVAEDVNDASRTDPRNVLISQGQSGTSADPGRLTFDTTYYWRVDEVNSPPDSTIFKGTNWSFTTEPLAYEIENVMSAASSENEPGTGAENTVNGSGLDAASGQHSTDLAQMWLNSATEMEGAWIQFDLGKTQKLDRMHVWNHNSQTEAILGYGMKEVLIETSLDGQNWTELKTVELAQATGSANYPGVDIPMDSVVAQLVRLTPLSNWSILGLKQVGLSEVRFFNIPVHARQESPADGTTTDGIDIVLQWRSGREAAQHEVVFSSDELAVIEGSAVVGTVDDPAFDLGTLDLGMHYYWKVNEINDVETPSTYTGDLWDFNTPDHTMIDDMEMYKAEEGLRIWEHWIDGFDDNTNGSVVGSGDDAEMAVVFEGSQSLPMAYDNTAAAMSEATRYFDPAVDLTAGHPESLKLQIHGDGTGVVIAADTISIGASGADLWSSADEGRFVYKNLSGDGSITAKVESLTHVHDWAKAGVMIRANPDADSADAYTVASAATGVTFQYRLSPTTDAASDSSTRSTEWSEYNERPVWVRVERVGNEFNGYISMDGVTWEASVENPQTIFMGAEAKIGLCVTSHDNAVSTQAVFSEISTTGNVTGNWEIVEWGGGDTGHPYNEPASIYVRLTDTTGKEQVIEHPNPEATLLETWEEWTLPLSDLTINAAQLDAITVGVASPGVQGKIYLDSIRVFRPYDDVLPQE